MGTRVGTLPVVLMAAARHSLLDGDLQLTFLRSTQGEASLTAATNSATVSSSVKTTARWDPHQSVRHLEPGGQDGLRPASRTHRPPTQVGVEFFQHGAVPPMRVRWSSSPQQSRLHEASAWGAQPPHLPWSARGEALKRCTSWMMRRMCH